jgi:ankyrin repeat protein
MAGWSPLHIAAKAGRLRLTSQLINQGSDVWAITGDANGYTALHLAAESGHVGVVRKIVETAGPNILHILNGFGQNALHHATAYGNLDCLVYLLQQGLDLSVVDKAGHSLILYGCASGSYVVVQKILDHDPQCLHNHGTGSWSPLHWACRSGTPKLIDLVLEHGPHEQLVSANQPPASWSPVTIGYLHRNRRIGVIEKKINDHARAKLYATWSSRPAKESVAQTAGSYHNGVGCNSCHQVSTNNKELNTSGG